MNTKTNLEMRPFDVRIPNLEGDGIAETIRIQVPVWIDLQSGEELLTPEALELIEKTKARRMGLMSPDEIRALRERLDVTQEDMSELLQIGAKSYTRWESGKARLSRSMNVLLCALRDGVITVEYLRCLRDGHDWTPLLNRRVQNSIVFFSDSSARPRASSGTWEAFATFLNRQPELLLQSRSLGRTHRRPKIQVCVSTFESDESAEAA